ncbi:zf-TFIIB domain-containing protein [Desulfopila sp. IMCC35008]|uniref:zf-TFIIB domain-containing protein n=1 Tax=Desulfopila sp. IMCC35008 TaxID=2653858 RepID=UPI0013D77948|nr:zf-TFIIB domain-containing protein [Desulfopila sp. IMCC35008]
MKCPKCHSDMEKVYFQTVEIDRCKDCKGLWFDLLEHEQLKMMDGSEEVDIGDPNVGKKFNDKDSINCPHCKARMVKMVDSKQSHIWYESCAICYGVFFDAGEFTDFKDETFTDYFKDILTRERK